MLGVLKLLFGGKNKHRITCPNCKHQGKMYTASGPYEGDFEIVGKTETAALLIKACPKCAVQLSYDPISGKASVY